MPDRTADTDAQHSEEERIAEAPVAEPEHAASADAEHGAAAEDGRTSEDAATPEDGADDPATDGGTPSGAAVGRRRVRLPGTRRGRVLLAAVLALLLAAVAGGVGWLRTTSLPEDAAFAYADRVVTVAELDARAEALRALYGVQPPSEPAALDTYRRDLAKSVAVSMVLDRAAAEREIVVADKQARDMLDRFIVERYAGDRDAFVRTLGEVGTSEPEVLEEIERQLAVGRLMDQVVGDVSISDERLRTAFEERREQLGTPERRVLRNIVVASEAEARAVLDQLRAATPVEEVAAQHSLDGSTKQTGGMLGEVARQQLEAPVGDAAFGVPVNELYGPVQGRHGWNVGRVDRILPPVPVEFDQVREPLRETLQAEVALTRWRDWLAERIAAAEVRYADDYRPADPDAAPAFGGPAAPPAAPPSDGAPR